MSVFEVKKKNKEKKKNQNTFAHLVGSKYRLTNAGLVVYSNREVKICNYSNA